MWGILGGHDSLLGSGQPRRSRLQPLSRSHQGPAPPHPPVGPFDPCSRGAVPHSRYRNREGRQNNEWKSSVTGRSDVANVEPTRRLVVLRLTPCVTPLPAAAPAGGRRGLGAVRAWRRGSRWSK